MIAPTQNRRAARLPAADGGPRAPSIQLAHPLGDVAGERLGSRHQEHRTTRKVEFQSRVSAHSRRPPRARVEMPDKRRTSARRRRRRRAHEKAAAPRTCPFRPSRTSRRALPPSGVGPDRGHGRRARDVCNNPLRPLWPPCRFSNGGLELSLLGLAIVAQRSRSSHFGEGVAVLRRRARKARR